jgi:hypothetical protein
MENKLISANGKGHSSIAIWWILCLAVGIAGGLLIIGAFTMLGYQRADGFVIFDRIMPYAVKNRFFITIGAICLACGVITGIVFQSRISKSAVDVYEDCVKGLGLAPDFPWFSIRGSGFYMTYDQVSSVDVKDKNKLRICTASSKHSVYAMNAGEVRDVILAQKKYAAA